jgi:glutamate dehydrogenase (NAD(P)+)
MAETFRFVDELGPVKVVEIHEPRSGLQAVLVVDNVAAGPAIGGVRMAPDVSAEECFRLARAMTFKNAAAGLRHGGGKAVIFGDPKQPPECKEALVRAFASAIAGITEYIPGPDMGTDELAMAWVEDEIGRAVGLPPELGGIPLDQIGATGFGLAAAAEVAAKTAGIELTGARVVVQGFGSVGRHAARFLTERGAVLVAASDSAGAVIDPEGLDVARLIALKDQGGQLRDHGSGQQAERDAVIDVPSEIWIPAARPDVIHEGNVQRLDTRLVLQGANIPFTVAAEAALHGRGVVVVPDFIANAGGVICAAVEYGGGSEGQALATIAEKIRANVRTVLDEAASTGVTPRQAAIGLAGRRVRRAMAHRRFGAWAPSR